MLPDPRRQESRPTGLRLQELVVARAFIARALIARALIAGALIARALVPRALGRRLVLDTNKASVRQPVNRGLGNCHGDHVAVRLGLRAGVGRLRVDSHGGRRRDQCKRHGRKQRRSESQLTSHSPLPLQAARPRQRCASSTGSAAVRSTSHSAVARRPVAHLWSRVEPPTQPGPSSGRCARRGSKRAMLSGSAPPVGDRRRIPLTLRS